MTLMDSDLTIFLPLLAMMPVIYASSFLHEVGHAVMAWASGFEVTSFGMGLGKPFWVGRVGGARVFLCRSKPFQGITFSFARQLMPSRPQAVGMLSGGILANVVLAMSGIALFVLVPWGRWLWVVIAAVNALMAVANALPFVFPLGAAALRSDGRQILDVLFARRPTVPPPARIQMRRALRDLWESVGDATGLWAHSLDAALAWCELGDAERSRELVAEAEALDVTRTPARRAFGALVRGAVLAAGGDRDGASLALAEAEAVFRDLGHPFGQFLTQAVRADALLQAGDEQAAESVLTGLNDSPIVKQQPGLKLTLVATRLGAAARRGDHDSVQALAREYMADRMLYPSLSRDLRVFALLGQYHARREEHPAAWVQYVNALSLASVLYRAFVHEEDRAHYLKVLERLVTAARESTAQFLPTPPPDRIDEMFPTSERVRQEQEDAKAKIDRKRWRLGMKVALVELAVCALAGVVLASWWFGKKPPDETEMGLFYGVVACVGFVVVFAAASSLLGMASAWVGRFKPLWVRGFGTAVVFLATMPWLTVLVFAAYCLMREWN